MLNYTKPELVQQISEEVTRIVFREVGSGEKSADLVTLDPNLVPATQIRTMLGMIERMEVIPDTRVYAWDIVKGKWISFYMENVDSVDDVRSSDNKEVDTEEEQEENLDKRRSYEHICSR